MKTPFFQRKKSSSLSSASLFALLAKSASALSSPSSYSQHHFLKMKGVTRKVVYVLVYLFSLLSLICVFLDKNEKTLKANNIFFDSSGDKIDANNKESACNLYDQNASNSFSTFVYVEAKITERAKRAFGQDYRNGIRSLCRELNVPYRLVKSRIQGSDSFLLASYQYIGRRYALLKRGMDKAKVETDARSDIFTAYDKKLEELKKEFLQLFNAKSRSDYVSLMKRNGQYPMDDEEIPFPQFTDQFQSLQNPFQSGNYSALQNQAQRQIDSLKSFHMQQQQNVLRDLQKQQQSELMQFENQMDFKRKQDHRLITLLDLASPRLKHLKVAAERLSSEMLLLQASGSQIQKLNEKMKKAKRILQSMLSSLIMSMDYYKKNIPRLVYEYMNANSNESVNDDSLIPSGSDAQFKSKALVSRRSPSISLSVNSTILSLFDSPIPVDNVDPRAIEFLTHFSRKNDERKKNVSNVVEQLRSSFQTLDTEMKESETLLSDISFGLYGQNVNLQNALQLNNQNQNQNDNDYDDMFSLSVRTPLSAARGSRTQSPFSLSSMTQLPGKISRGRQADSVTLGLGDDRHSVRQPASFFGTGTYFDNKRLNNPMQSEFNQNDSKISGFLQYFKAIHDYSQDARSSSKQMLEALEILQLENDEFTRMSSQIREELIDGITEYIAIKVNQYNQALACYVKDNNNNGFNGSVNGGGRASNPFMNFNNSNLSNMGPDNMQMQYFQSTAPNNTAQSAMPSFRSNMSFQKSSEKRERENTQSLTDLPSLTKNDKSLYEDEKTRTQSKPRTSRSSVSRSQYKFFDRSKDQAPGVTSEKKGVDPSSGKSMEQILNARASELSKTANGSSYLLDYEKKNKRKTDADNSTSATSKANLISQLFADTKERRLFSSYEDFLPPPASSSSLSSPSASSSSLLQLSSSRSLSAAYPFSLEMEPSSMSFLPSGTESRFEDSGFNSAFSDSCEPFADSFFSSVYDVKEKINARFGGMQAQLQSIMEMMNGESDFDTFVDVLKTSIEPTVSEIDAGVEEIVQYVKKTSQSNNNSSPSLEKAISSSTKILALMNALPLAHKVKLTNICNSKRPDLPIKQYISILEKEKREVANQYKDIKGKIVFVKASVERTKAKLFAQHRRSRDPNIFSSQQTPFPSQLPMNDSRSPFDLSRDDTMSQNVFNTKF